MSNENWENIETIFHKALDLTPIERKSYLFQACSGNASLLSEVESLISAFDKGTDFLDQPVFTLGLGILNEKPYKSLTNSTIGFYQVQERIGRGGMGEVYKAVDTRLNRKVALKFLSDSFADDKWARRQLIKEAQAVAMLEHPNICAVHGIEQTDKYNFIVMQYIEGTTLAENIRDLPSNIEHIKSIVNQIVTAVAFAHSHGIIHRDLKPGNIMLNNDGQIKVLDFGLAKVIQQKQNFEREIENPSLASQSELIFGTVSYMSPEQLRAEKLDYRSDIFSLGIVLYELIAQNNPFNRKSQAETISAILSCEPVPLKQIVPGLPENLENVVRKCLQKDKESRFQSAPEILVALDKVETGNLSPQISKRLQRFAAQICAATVIFILIYLFIFFQTKNPLPQTLAVLPISYEGTQTKNEYLAEGLTQSIIEKLSNLSGLKVKNESFVSPFKGRTIEPQTAGKELQVDAVFVGSIVERDAGLFLTTKLVRTSDGYVLDTEEFKVEELGLIELQENISSQIISRMQSHLTAEDKNKLVKKDTENSEAKRLYIRGRFYLSRRKNDDLKNADRDFREATNLDPSYAKAWAGLADTYAFYSVPGNEGAMSPEEAVISAKAAAKNSLEIDSTLCEPYNSLGLIKLRYEWDWAGAESYFRTAINLNPDFAPAHLGLLNLWTIKGQFDEALAEARKSKELNPFSVSSDLNLASVYYYQRDYKQMNKVLSESLEKNPNNNRISYMLAFQFLQTGKLAEATEIFEKIYESDKLFASAGLGYVYAKTGRKDDARRILAELEILSKHKYVPSQEKAYIYLGLGELDKVFENLNKSCAERFSALPYLVVDPLYEEIKSDARFAGIKQCVNL